jgi:hypothetical protein
MKPPFPSGRGSPVRAVSIRSFQEKLRQVKSAGCPVTFHAFLKPANAVLRDREGLLESIEAGLATCARPLRTVWHGTSKKSYAANDRRMFAMGLRHIESFPMRRRPFAVVMGTRLDLKHISSNC